MTDERQSAPEGAAGPAAQPDPDGAMSKAGDIALTLLRLLLFVLLLPGALLLSVVLRGLGGGRRRDR